MVKKDLLRRPYPPMEARLVEQIPQGRLWQYEPKWDGFRCMVFREGQRVILQSKAGRPLGRYFPELVEEILRLAPKRFVLDGEIVSYAHDQLNFDQLLQRIHPAASRIKMLASKSPAHLMVFDLLADETNKALAGLPLTIRRRSLERFASRHIAKGSLIRLSPATKSAARARKWLIQAGSFFDGIVAKRLDLAYSPGKSDAMQKYKPKRSADCVVGGFRYASKSRVVGSLLLGLYDHGLLHHVGFTSGLKAEERKEWEKKLRPLIAPPGFTGRAPGGPSRWSTERSAAWTPLRPKLVVEVAYDHVTADRFRHGTKLLRWRPDKKPSQCTMDQIRK